MSKCPTVTEEKKVLYGHHFKLGNEGGPNISEYIDKYRGWRASRIMSEQERTSMLLNLRGTHYTVGTDNVNHRYRTTNGEFGATVKGAIPSSLNESEKNDLRRSHFTLGDQCPNYMSESGNSYQQPKGRGSGPFDQALLNDLRREHFTLGNDQDSYVTCSEQFHHRMKPDDVDKDKWNSLVKDLRSSHFHLGSEGKHYDTSNHMPDYKGEREPPPQHMDLSRSHFNIGDQKVDYRTEYMRQNEPFKNPQSLLASIGDQCANPMDFNGQPPKRPAELYQTNFRVGSEGPNYVTETKAEYQKHDLDAKPPQDPALWNTHWTLGDECPNYMTESYRKDPYKNNFQPSNLNEEKKDDLRKCHYKLGSENTEYLTDYQREFHKQPLECKPEQDPNFQKTHYDIGTEGTDYRTMYGTNYIDHKYRVSDQEVEKQKKLIHDLRSTHYTLGDQQNDYSTTSKLPGYDASYSAAQPTLRLWGHHYQLGDAYGVYNTTYANMSSGYKADYFE